MTLCLFSTIFFVLFANLSMGCLRLTQIDRTFMDSYKGMYEACVITIDSEGEPIKPYFDQTLIRYYLAEYLEPNVKKYTTDYFMNVKFYTGDNDVQCKSERDKARKVRVFLEASINFLFGYSKGRNFVIKERTELWMIN